MKDNSNRNKILYEYAGFASQLMVALGLAVYGGYWSDKKLNLHFPLLLWVLPLAVIAVMIVKVIKDTSNK
jgi:hypothetical protein